MPAHGSSRALEYTWHVLMGEAWDKYPPVDINDPAPHPATPGVGVAGAGAGAGTASPASPPPASPGAQEPKAPVVVAPEFPPGVDVLVVVAR